MDCIFCKIIKGEIPTTKIYEDDKVIAFNDIEKSLVDFGRVGYVHLVSMAPTSDCRSVHP